jgi:hypothetical protein
MPGGFVAGHVWLLSIGLTAAGSSADDILSTHDILAQDAADSPLSRADEPFLETVR